MDRPFFFLRSQSAYWQIKNSNYCTLQKVNWYFFYIHVESFTRGATLLSIWEDRPVRQKIPFFFFWWFFFLPWNGEFSSNKNGLLPLTYSFASWEPWKSCQNSKWFGMSSQPLKAQLLLFILIRVRWKAHLFRYSHLFIIFIHIQCFIFPPCPRIR